MLEYIIIGALLVIIVALTLQIKKINSTNTQILETQVINSNLSTLNKDLQNQLLMLQEDIGLERERNRVLLSQKKSNEVRLGQISEHLIPFLEGCRHDAKNMHFLGNPLDYIVFNVDEGEITFLEIKSGNSKPSKKQKTIKNIIRSGRVFYEELRINEKGIKSKLLPNIEPPQEGEDIGED